MPTASSHMSARTRARTRNAAAKCLADKSRRPRASAKSRFTLHGFRLADPAHQAGLTFSLSDAPFSYVHVDPREATMAGSSREEPVRTTALPQRRQDQLARSASTSNISPTPSAKCQDARTPEHWRGEKAQGRPILTIVCPARTPNRGVPALSLSDIPS
jgi:hypothetical protein